MAKRPGASNSLRYGLEELKFVRSLEDLQILRAKVAYKSAGRRAARQDGILIPPSLYVEPTNYCNLRCTTCPSWRSGAPRGFMDMDLFRRIIREASEVGVQRIQLFLRGEPLLHPHVVEMVAYIKENRLPVHLTTNGTQLTPERGVELLGAGVDSSDQVTVSFLGHSKATHEATMVGSDHDRVVANVLAFVKAREDMGVNGPVIETILNPTSETEAESDEFLAFWRGQVDHARIGGISTAFQEYKRDGAPGVRRCTSCTQIYERMPVLWDGTVLQCNVDFDGDRVIGNLNESGILDVWNCERMQEVRRIHREGRFEVLPDCLHCDM